MNSDQTYLIPIDRYRVDYEVGSGAPFSEVDILILRAVVEEHASNLERLAEVLMLPRRLLIESLVGLAKAGWLSIGGPSGGFAATQQGRLAISMENPPMPERLIPRQGTVLVERLTGQIAASRDLTYITTRKLQESGIWDACKRIPRNPAIQRLDMGQIKPLLLRGKNEWIRWVGEPLPQQEAWLQVQIESGHKRLHGLPEAWKSALTARLAEQLDLPELLVRHPTDIGKSPAQSSIAARSWRFTNASSSVVLDGKAHLAVLHRAFAEAKSQLLMASAFINADVIEQDLAPSIISAVGRGVRVDLLWGYSSGTTAEDRRRTLKSLQALRKACAGAQMLRFNEDPTGSHAKVLAWDTAADCVCICVGSHNWLSVRTAGYEDSHRQEVSVLADHRGLAADICTTIASLWTQTKTPMTGVADLWQHTAGILERLAAQSSTPSWPVTDDTTADDPSGRELQTEEVAARQVRDQEHEALMRDLLLGAKHRLAVVSHKIGPKALVRLASMSLGMRGLNTKPAIRVLVGEVPQDAGDLLGQVESIVSNEGGRFAIRPGVHAKLILADDTVLVSSYNFLSADPFGTATNAREVGICVSDKVMSDTVWAWVERLS